MVHRVPTEDFDLDGNKRQGIEKILEENDLGEKRIPDRGYRMAKEERQAPGKIGIYGDLAELTRGNRMDYQ